MGDVQRALDRDDGDCHRAEQLLRGREPDHRAVDLEAGGGGAGLSDRQLCLRGVLVCDGGYCWWAEALVWADE